MLDAHGNFSHSSNIILLGFCFFFSPFTFASTKLLPFPPIFYIQTPWKAETTSLQNTELSVLAMAFDSHPLNSSSIRCHSNLSESPRCHLGYQLPGFHVLRLYLLLLSEITTSKLQNLLEYNSRKKAVTRGKYSMYKAPH